MSRLVVKIGVCCVLLLGGISACVSMESARGNICQIDDDCWGGMPCVGGFCGGRPDWYEPITEEPKSADGSTLLLDTAMPEKNGPESTSSTE
ncbi:MAG TPA: hypothetical protein DCE42_14035 [Myxococcales bacterium]|nr:hypothetical protein [Deltaproteobacteria bacterium]HAA55878.1 hypothetical protein [Myxococcales bacterium]|tara:strand:+ start:2204 stop:2479 length:276 start_codon:yes stop_codon:yes gene_type:complete